VYTTIPSFDGLAKMSHAGGTIGVWQRRRLEIVSAVYVADIFVRPSVARHNVSVDVELVNTTNERVAVSVAEAMVAPFDGHFCLPMARSEKNAVDGFFGEKCCGCTLFK
jgi:hypothetical protein